LNGQAAVDARQCVACAARGYSGGWTSRCSSTSRAIPPI